MRQKRVARNTSRSGRMRWHANSFAIVVAPLADSYGGMLNIPLENTCARLHASTLRSSGQPMTGIQSGMRSREMT